MIRYNHSKSNSKNRNDNATKQQQDELIELINKFLKKDYKVPIEKGVKAVNTLKDNNYNHE